MLLWIIAAGAGLGAAALSYAGGGSAARVGLPALCRGAAIALVAALLLDAPAARAPAARPLVALDASASWLRGGDSTRWAAARQAVAAAARGDSVLLFGDSARSAAAARSPTDHASRARPAVERALATGRTLVLVTDGEIDDPESLVQLPGGSRVIVPGGGNRRPDAAVISADAPASITTGDTLVVRATIGAGAAGSRAGRASLSLGTRVAATVPFDSLSAFAERSIELRAVPTAADRSGIVHLTIAAPGDAEPRNDTLSIAVEVSATAGAVLVSTSPDYDARYALDVLRGTLALPTRGYFRVAPGVWRVDGTLAPIAERDVRTAAAAAPLVVLHGDTAIFGPPRNAMHGALALLPTTVLTTTAPAAASAGAGAAEEWFAVAAPASPLSAALSALQWDSLPPLAASGAEPRGEWTGLELRRGRAGERRAGIAGSERPRRVVVVAASGFWRWRFRAGAGAAAFTALWGSIFDWLAAERGDVRLLMPETATLREGEPVRWRRTARADSTVRALVTRRGAPASADTLMLRFVAGASVVESPPLAAGVYDVRVPGGSVVLAVNASRELLPRRATVVAGAVGGAPPARPTPPLRDLGWPYVIVVGLLCGEWALRRRSGMR